MHSSERRDTEEMTKDMAHPSEGDDIAIQIVANVIEKPMLDERSYRVIRLSNELEALLIHDANATKAAAAMDVGVGSFADSLEMQGTAHAVEHLLFMGTRKYPGENDYNSYLSKHGGCANAFTAATSTKYYFELSVPVLATHSGSDPAHTADEVNEQEAPLQGALDRFSQFFVCPLFLQHTVDRELRAVDSENRKNLFSDEWRLMQLGKSLSNPDHPYSKFSTGNFETLYEGTHHRGASPRDELIAFYQKHYSADRMKLVVLGSESLDLLQSWVGRHFSAIPNKRLGKLSWDDVPALRNDELCTQIFAKPVQDRKMLQIDFPYPDEQELHTSRPGLYIGHLIGHEGRGSILSSLKAKGLAVGIDVGIVTMCASAALLSIKIHLTAEGVREYMTVICTVFEYVSILKSSSLSGHILHEQTKLAGFDFHYGQEISPSNTIRRLSSIMQTSMPRKWLLSGRKLIRDLNMDGITAGLDALRTNNFRFMLVSRDLPGDLSMRERWYGTQYRYEKIPSADMRRIEVASQKPITSGTGALALPAKNGFVPDILGMETIKREHSVTNPYLVRGTAKSRIWYKEDDRFRVPRTNVKILLRTPWVNATPLAAVLTQLYKEVIEDNLSEQLYDARIAGFHYAVGRSEHGFNISAGGYSDKVPLLLESLLVTMRDLKIDPARFAAVKEHLLQDLRNFKHQKPHSKIAVYSRWIRELNAWTPDQMLEELTVVTARDLELFIPCMKHPLHVEMLAHGSLQRAAVFQMADLVEQMLDIRSHVQSDWSALRRLVLPSGIDFLYRPVLGASSGTDSCIELTIQIGDGQDRTLQAKLLVFAQLAGEPLFNALRTTEQLGYICSGRPIWNGTHIAYRVLVQSKKPCEYLEQRIDAFLLAFEEKLKQMSEIEFNAHKIGAINQRLERTRNMGEETARLWHHIMNETYDFETVYHETEYMRLLVKDDLLEFTSTHVSPRSPTRATLSIHLTPDGSLTDQPSAAGVRHSNRGDRATLLPIHDAESRMASRQPDERSATSERTRELRTNKMVAIDDVRSFKASLHLSPGPRPVQQPAELMLPGLSV